MRILIHRTPGRRRRGEQTFEIEQRPNVSEPLPQRPWLLDGVERFVLEDLGLSVELGDFGVAGRESVHRSGRHRRGDLDGHGDRARVALGAKPGEAAHAPTLPVVTRAIRRARGAVGSLEWTTLPRAGSSRPRRC